MATRLEEIITRMGYDSSAVTRGTQAMLDGQKKAQLEYVSFWKRAITEKETAQTNIEIEAATRRNRARQLLRDRELEQEKRHAKQMAEVAQGYMPESFQNQAALNQKYGKYGYRGGKFGNAENMGGMIGGQIAGDIASHESPREIGGEIGMMAAAGAGMTMGTLGARMLLKRFGRTLAKGLGEGALKVLGVVGAAFTGWEVGEWINDRYINKAAEKSMEMTGETREKLVKRIEQQIKNLVGGGKLTEDQAEAMSGQLGTFTGIHRIQKQLSGFSPHDLNNKSAAEVRRLDDEHARKMEELAHKQISVAEKLKVSTAAVAEKQREMWGMERDSLEFKKKRAELDDLLLQKQADANELEKQQAEQVKKTADEKQRQIEKQRELNDEASQLALRIGHNSARIDEQGTEYPTVGEVAKKGNSPYSALARAFLRAQKDQVNARMYAQTYDYWSPDDLAWHHVNRDSIIEGARRRENAARGRLEDLGVLKPELDFHKMVVNTNLMIQKLDAIHKKGGKEDPMFIADE